MNIESAKEILFRTHTWALVHSTRAACYTLEGAPGLGKSQGVFQYAENLAGHLARSKGEPVAVGVVQIMLTTVTPPDVRGFMLPVREQDGRMRTVFSTPPWFPDDNFHVVIVDPQSAEADWYLPGEWDVAKYGVPEHGVLFLDEWGQADEDVKKPAAELVLNANVGTARLPIGWRVVCAQNRMSDRSGVLREMMFIVNRRLLLAVEPDMKAWLNWASGQAGTTGPHYMTQSFAEKHPDIVFTSAVPNKPDPFCTPRSLCMADHALKALMSDEDEQLNRLPMGALARETVAGAIGEGSAAQFFTHLRFDDLIPRLADVVKDPGAAKLPDAMDAQLVTGHMLAHGIDEKNAGQVMKYVLRMKDEMQIITVNSIRRNEKKAKIILVQPSYQTWAMKHKDRLIAAQS